MTTVINNVNHGGWGGHRGGRVSTLTHFSPKFGPEMDRLEREGTHFDNGSTRWDIIFVYADPN